MMTKLQVGGEECMRREEVVPEAGVSEGVGHHGAGASHGEADERGQTDENHAQGKCTTGTNIKNSWNTLN